METKSEVTSFLPRRSALRGSLSRLLTIKKKMQHRYNERRLKDVNLGSVIVLVVLRVVTANLNRIKDVYLQGNCLAVLSNLMRQGRDINAYTSLRLVTVLVSSLQKYNRIKNNMNVNAGAVANNEPGVEDARDICEMAGGVAETLLRGLSNCLRPDNVASNVHLIYALVHRANDWTSAVKTLRSLNKSESTGMIGSSENKKSRYLPLQAFDVKRISAVIDFAKEILEGATGGGGTAEEALNLLKSKLGGFRRIVSRGKAAAPQTVSGLPPPPTFKTVDLDGGADEDSDDDEWTGENTVDELFMYEEEEDTESFFVPYLWSIIVESVSVGELGVDIAGIKVYDVDFELDEVKSESEQVQQQTVVGMGDGSGSSGVGTGDNGSAV